jgi:hypothetical protein
MADVSASSCGCKFVRSQSEIKETKWEEERPKNPRLQIRSDQMSNEVNMPGSDWQSYLCKINDELASVFVDLAKSAVAPLPTRPKLVWLWIRLNQPRQDGLSSDAEFQSLCDFEDDLEASIEQSGACVYVGRITTKGRREFYFYAEEKFDLNAGIAGVLAKHSTYAFQKGEKLDASWDHFLQTLLPGPNGLDQIAQRKAQQ